jgi:hypothetical protein
VRSVHDGLYRVAYEVSEGHPPRKPQRASMTRALKPADPVRALLGTDAEDYFKWFEGWRNLRNTIKTGRPSGVIGPPSPTASPDDIGINLASVSEDGALEVDLSRGTRVSDITRAIAFTHLVTARTLTLLEANAMETQD